MKILQPPGWTSPRGYVNGVAARGTTVFVGGQVGWNAQQRAIARSASSTASSSAGISRR